MIKILIADDQLLLRESISFILNNDEEIEVVGEAGNGLEVIEQCKKLKPDIILMDMEMPKMDGINATKAIKDSCNAKVIILTTFENPDNIMEAFTVGADGYVVKEIRHNDLILAIKCVASGLTVIHESVKKVMIDRFKGLSDYRSLYSDLLTEKEVQIIKLIATGKSNKEIGSALCYSEGTIKNKVSKILSKLDMSDRMQIAIFAMEKGIL